MRESPLPNDTKDESSDTSYWYVLTPTQQFGPIFFSRLRQMAHQGTLDREDKVRRGKTGEWERAEDIIGDLFPDTADLEIGPAQAVKPKVPPQVREPGALANLVTSIRDRIESFYDGLKQAFVDRLGNIRAIVSWLALIGVFGALAVVLVRQTSFDQLFAQDPAKFYISVLDEVKEKRKINASTAEWDEFATKTRKSLSSVISRLERTASVDNQIAQQLLWAGRDYLSPMLDDARSKESLSEEKFTEHLQRAQWLKEGKSVHGVPQRYRPGPYAGLPDALTMLFGIVFVVVDVLIVLWLLGKRRSAKTNS